MPAAIAWLWATISVVGFAIVDGAGSPAGTGHRLGGGVRHKLRIEAAMREIGQVSRADG
jgi:hypothetical protein